MSNAAPDLALSRSLPADAAPAPLSSDEVSPAAPARVADEAIDPAFLSRSSRRAISARPLPFDRVALDAPLRRRDNDRDFSRIADTAASIGG